MLKYKIISFYFCYYHFVLSTHMNKIICAYYFIHMCIYPCIIIINLIRIELLNDHLLSMSPDPSGNMGQNNFGGETLI